MSFTAQQVREIIAVYGKWPDTPEGYEEPEEWREVTAEEWCLGKGGSATMNVNGAGPRLILRPKPKRWRYTSDGVRRQPHIGDFLAVGSRDDRKADMWYEVRVQDEFYYDYLVFTREEVE